MPRREGSVPTGLANMPSLYARFAEVYQSTCAAAVQAYVEASGAAAEAWIDMATPRPSHEAWRDVMTYWSDFAQRSLLFVLGYAATARQQLDRAREGQQAPAVGLRF